MKSTPQVEYIRQELNIHILQKKGIVFFYLWFCKCITWFALFKKKTFA